MFLPPPRASFAKSDGSVGEAVAEAVSRRRRLIDYLLGNMMRMLEGGGRAAKHHHQQNGGNGEGCRKCGIGKVPVDLKLMNAPKSANYSPTDQPPLPLPITIQMEKIREEKGKAEKVMEKLKKHKMH